MKILDFFEAPRNKFEHPAITLGMFDGVHLGHQKLLKLLREERRQTAVVTFKQHPKSVLAQNSPPTIMPLEKRLEFFKEEGVDLCLLIDFTPQIAAISADAFILEHLVERIGMSVVVIGKNFRFGNKGAGNHELFRKYADDYGYRVIAAEIKQMAQQQISSSNIRKYVMQGEMRTAQQMLGRPYSLIGKVVPGKQRGRQLGFPTANLDLHHGLCPPHGVYCGYSQIAGKKYPALISIGTCPTFEEREAVKVEVYLVDFSGDLYGKNLEVAVWEKMREQEVYDSVQALCRQIEKDQESLMRRYHIFSKSQESG